MNCLCNLFDNEVLWLAIIALLILNCTCNGNSGCGGPVYSSYNNGCGCGCN